MHPSLRAATMAAPWAGSPITRRPCPPSSGMCARSNWHRVGTPPRRACPGGVAVLAPVPKERRVRTFAIGADPSRLRDNATRALIARFVVAALVPYAASAGDAFVAVFTDQGAAEAFAEQQAAQGAVLLEPAPPLAAVLVGRPDGATEVVALLHDHAVATFHIRGEVRRRGATTRTRQHNHTRKPGRAGTATAPRAAMLDGERAERHGAAQPEADGAAA